MSSKTELKKMLRHAEIQRSHAITAKDRALWDRRIEELKRLIKDANGKNRDDRSRPP